MNDEVLALELLKISYTHGSNIYKQYCEILESIENYTANTKTGKIKELIEEYKKGRICEFAMINLIDDIEKVLGEKE